MEVYGQPPTGQKVEKIVPELNVIPFVLWWIIVPFGAVTTNPTSLVHEPNWVTTI